ncbi:MAG: hypothetical protein ACXQTN_06875 [Methanoculleaceae archaeon]
MPYRWTRDRDAEEAVVTVMNVLDEEDGIPEWLLRTLRQAITDSDPECVRHFFDEVREHVPEALKFFGEEE